jgi:WD40 repeat protein
MQRHTLAERQCAGGVAKYRSRVPSFRAHRRTSTSPTLLAAHSSPVLCVAFSPDGEGLVSGGADKPKIKVWNTNTGELLLLSFPIDSLNGFRMRSELEGCPVALCEPHALEQATNQ